MLSIKDKEKFITKYCSYLDAVMTFSLASLPKNRMPILQVSMDEGCWTDHEIIHIGIKDADIETEEELMVWALFRLGHECQHILSTTNKSWEYGLNEGFHIICRHISKQIDKIPRLFRKESDYDQLLEDAKASGIILDKKSAIEMVHFIINSVEDGRIERIRSLKRPGFLNYMIMCRGKDWESVDISNDNFNEKDPTSYIVTVLNQVLVLSTMSIYQKGFVNIAYKNRAVHRTILGLIPYIRDGVKAPTCRKGVENALKIVDALADDIVKACLANDMSNILQQVLQNAMDKAGSEDKDYSYSDSRTEDSGEGLENEDFSPFGSSLDDKLKEQSKNNHQSSSNKDDDKQNDNSSSKSEYTQGGGSDETSSVDGSSHSSGGSSEDEQNSQAESSSTQNSSGSKSIKDAMDKASRSSSTTINVVMEQAKANASLEINNSIKAGNIDKRKQPKTPVDGEGLDKPVTDVYDIGCVYPNNVTFKEYFRDYKPDSIMPLELSGKGNTLKRKIQKIFKNQESPLLRGQKAGALDIASLYKLPLGQVDLFQKKAIDNEFDGCCYFLMDNSGSMGNGRGSKRYHCCRALSIMETAFQDVMPLKIVAFDATCDSNVRHNVIKNWSEKVSLNGSYNYLKHKSSGSGNKDGYSIRVATKELLSRSEDKKILIVLSDGLPSCYSYEEDGEADVHDAVANARKQGIEVVSIYFSHDIRNDNNTSAFKKMYERNSIVTEPEKISDELVRILKKFCFR